jgi:hypothetical protein
MLRGVLLLVPGLGPLLPEPSFLRAFVGATAVSTLVAGLAVRVGSAAFEFDSLTTETRSFDESTTDEPPTTPPREVSD